MCPFSGKMPETQGPGINLETSEVFQTSDLPEADQVEENKINYNKSI